jgi:hypothetical protein
MLTQINLKTNRRYHAYSLKLHIRTHYPAGNEKAGTQGSNLKAALFWKHQLHAVHTCPSVYVSF